MTNEVSVKKCYWCELQFDKKELYTLTMHNEPVCFYICNSCLDYHPSWLKETELPLLVF